MTITHEKKWYAVYTNPRAEKKTYKALSDIGVETYLPLQTTLKQWSDRKKKVEEPLFKSYLFVNINYEKEFLTVLQTKGVVKFVKIGNEIPPIRHDIIQAIQLALAHYENISVTNIDFKTNERVKVVGGALNGYIGTIVNKNGNTYFSIAIEELGSQLAIKIPVQYLQKI